MPGADPTGSVFDYVIVGGGSAGCVLTNRLSADPSVTVCLLEAGPEDRHPYIHIPIGFVGLMHHPVLNWGFHAAPRPEVGGRSIYTPRGRVLGGTSAVNGMVYVRGHPTDYDGWAAAGCIGWSFAEVLPYFKRSEDNPDRAGSPFHATGGELGVMDHRHPNRMSRVLIEAAQSLGFDHNPDFNDGERQEGFGIRQVTQRRGRRQSAATAFLAPVRSRRNLEVITGCSADRLLLEQGRAVGVEARIAGEARRIGAMREVIVAAGTVNSPTLLMRSGIGDGELLQRIGIETTRHLPGVGRNMQDHTCIGLDWTAMRSPSYGISLHALPALAGSLFEYLSIRSGMLASNIVEAGGFVRTDPSLTRPDLSFTFMSARRNPGGKMGHGHGYALVAQLLRPKTRGRVTLSGADPGLAPVIDPGCLKEEEDLEVLLQGLKLGRRLLDTPAFRRYDGKEDLPGAGVTGDDELRAYIRDYCATAFHSAGTCAMGTGGMAVVDPALRVHGIEGLRVVDASVMPTIIGGNTNAPTIMIAEKAADMILGKPAPDPLLYR